MLLDVTPRPAAPDLRDRAGLHSETCGDFLLLNVATEQSANASDDSGRQLRLRVLRASKGRRTHSGSTLVFARRYPFEVFRTVVAWVAVLVVDFVLGCRRGSEECFSYQPMHVELTANLVGLRTDFTVALGEHGLCQDLPAVSHLSVTGNIEVVQVSPAFLHGGGH